MYLTLRGIINWFVSLISAIFSSILDILLFKSPINSLTATCFLLNISCFLFNIDVLILILSDIFILGFILEFILGFILEFILGFILLSPRRACQEKREEERTTMQTHYGLTQALVSV